MSKTLKTYLHFSQRCVVLFVQVCIPGLHISLGVFKKIFDDLEDQCFELDKKIQLQLAVESGQLAEEECNEKVLPLRTASRHKIRAGELRENAEALQEMLTMQSMHSQETLMLNISALQNEVARMQKQTQQEVTYCRHLVKKYTTECNTQKSENMYMYAVC